MEPHSHNGLGHRKQRHEPELQSAVSASAPLQRPLCHSLPSHHLPMLLPSLVQVGQMEVTGQRKPAPWWVPKRTHSRGKLMGISPPSLFTSQTALESGPSELLGFPTTSEVSKGGISLTSASDQERCEQPGQEGSLYMEDLLSRCQNGCRSQSHKKSSEQSWWREQAQHRVGDRCGPRAHSKSVDETRREPQVEQSF